MFRNEVWSANQGEQGACARKKKARRMSAEKVIYGEYAGYLA